MVDNTVENCKVMCEICQRWVPVERTEYNKESDGNVCEDCCHK